MHVLCRALQSDLIHRTRHGTSTSSDPGVVSSSCKLMSSIYEHLNSSFNPISQLFSKSSGIDFFLRRVDWSHVKQVGIELSGIEMSVSVAVGAHLIVSSQLRTKSRPTSNCRRSSFSALSRLEIKIFFWCQAVRDRSSQCRDLPALSCRRRALLCRVFRVCCSRTVRKTDNERFHSGLSNSAISPRLC